MIPALENYYRSEGILSTEFTCPHKTQCSAGCDSFTGPKSVFVSTGYEAGVLPRLLFLSLDSGSGEKNNHERLPLAVRQQNEEDRDTLTLHKGKHWYRTHELAWYILKKFKSDLAVKDVKHYFAHANSAKCCMNKKHRKKADQLLFKNCQKYLLNELAILNPKILVTQGNEAKIAIKKFKTHTLQEFDEFAKVIKLNGAFIFWLHTYHPNNYGAFNKQKNPKKERQGVSGWITYSNLIYQFANAAAIDE